MFPLSEHSHVDIQDAITRQRNASLAFEGLESDDEEVSGDDNTGHTKDHARGHRPLSPASMSARAEGNGAPISSADGNPTSEAMDGKELASSSSSSMTKTVTDTDEDIASFSDSKGDEDSTSSDVTGKRASSIDRDTSPESQCDKTESESNEEGSQSDKYLEDPTHGVTQETMIQSG